MVLEGIVTQVIPQKERDLIAKLLLRDGTIVSLYVYGGMGGGKSSKPRVFEPASMMKVDVRSARPGASGDLLTVSESTLVWRSTHVRHDAKAFALVCLYLEMCMKTAVTHQPDGSPEEHAGLFNVLSNALFHLDQSLAEKHFQWTSHLVLFLSKFLHQLGVLPDESICVFCDSELEDDAMAPLVQEHGGFGCASCMQQQTFQVSFTPVRAFLGQAVRTKFQDWRQVAGLRTCGT